MVNQQTLNFFKKELINKLKDIDLGNLSKNDQNQKVALILDELSETYKIYLKESDKQNLLTLFLEEIVYGFGKIQKLIDDPKIEEIMINGCQNIFIKKRLTGNPELYKNKFNSPLEINKIIEKLLQGTGRRVDKSSPLVDLRLTDGSRVNIITSPLSLIGPCITIRKFPEKNISIQELLTKQMFDLEIFEFLKNAVQNKKNMLICGATASGKTTLLASLLDLIANDLERIIVLEETSEIKLPKRLINSLNLESRPKNLEGTGEFSIRDLLKNSLRMRPNRIVVGEVRGAEAFDMLQAMNTGHPGSFGTIHANSTLDCLQRLEALVLLAGFEQLPLKTIQQWIKSSLDLIIYLEIDETGKRVIKQISTLDHNYQVLDLFTYQNHHYQKNKDNLNYFNTK